MKAVSGSPIAVAVEGVTAGYARTVVLRDVTLNLQPGSVAALLGPNGAGKSTLLRVISGLITPQAGRIQLDGIDITTRSAHHRASLGLCHVPEARGIFRNLTVKENLRLQVRRSSASKTVDLAFEAFPILRQRARQRAGSLSGGEQQMLALARAYIAQPRVVLLDEPSLGLAPKVVDSVFLFLKRLVSDGAALLLVEQYVSQALAIADHVYILSRGTIVFSGTPGQLGDDQLAAGYLGTAGTGSRR
jgi:branched-chain amino acid transport system ATP-binding protein